MLRYELEDLAMRPDQEPLLVEQIHAAAYRHTWRILVSTRTSYIQAQFEHFSRAIVHLICGHGIRGNTLGLPKICPQENIGAISRQTLYTYLSAYHRYRIGTSTVIK